MAKQSSVNLDITNNADGFDISGGTTPRKLGITGGDVTIAGSGSATVTFPTTSTTIAGLGITQSFSALQSFSAGISASGATFSGNLSAPNIMNSWNGSTGAVTFTNYVTSFNGLTGVLQGVSAAVAGTGIAVSGATGSVTITNTGVQSFNGLTGAVLADAVPWSVITADQTAVINKGYFTNKATVLGITLPSTAAVGSVLRVSGMTAGGWKITQNASGVIHFGKTDTTVGTGGYIQSTLARDAVEMICCVVNNEWNVVSSVGNITIV